MERINFRLRKSLDDDIRNALPKQIEAEKLDVSDITRKALREYLFKTSPASIRDIEMEQKDIQLEKIQKTDEELDNATDKLFDVF